MAIKKATKASTKRATNQPVGSKSMGRVSKQQKAAKAARATTKRNQARRDSRG